jgi:hypothetical protein
LADIQGVSSLRDGQSVQVEAWTVCMALSHAPMLDRSEVSRKPLEAILAPLAAGVPDLVLPRSAYLVC